MKIETARDILVVDDLFKDSKFFLEKAREYEDRDRDTTMRYLRASVITAFAALEAHANAILFALGAFADLEFHERAFVEEKRIELADDGYFETRGQQYRSLEQKIKFLYWRMEGKSIPNGSSVWKAFRDATGIRNRLVHPKPGQLVDPTLTVASTKSCLIAVLRVSKMLGGPSLNLEKSAKG